MDFPTLGGFRKVACGWRSMGISMAGIYFPTIVIKERSEAMAFKMNHVHIKTKNPEKTAQFYVDTMGAKIIGKAGKNGLRIDLHGLHMNISDFLENQTREQKYGIEHIAIDTDELDTLVKKLADRGINILEQTVVSGGRRVCFFEGPDGVQLEFIEIK